MSLERSRADIAGEKVLCELCSAPNIKNLWKNPHNRSTKMKLSQLEPLSFATFAVLAAIVFFGFRSQWIDARDPNQTLNPPSSSDPTPSKSEPVSATPKTVGPNKQLNSAQVIIQDSIRFLRSKSIASDIRQRGFLFEKEILSSGTYLQSEDGHSSRLELEMETEQLQLKLRLFNDGVYFYRQIFPNSVDAVKTPQQSTSNGTFDPRNNEVIRRIERIHMRAVNNKFSNHAVWPGHWISYGGLYHFVDQFRRCFSISKTKNKIRNGSEYVVVKGVWKPENLAVLIPQQKRSILSDNSLKWDQIPPQIPMEIEIWFHSVGPVKSHPFRIIFYRPEKEVLEGYKQIPILVTEFSNTRIIEKPDSSLFQFNADENEVHDITEDFFHAIHH